MITVPRPRRAVRTGWSAEHVQSELERLLEQHAVTHDPDWAMVALFERVGRKLPAGVRLYYDGTAYVPADYAGDVSPVVESVITAELVQFVRAARPGVDVTPLDVCAPRQ